MTKAANLASFGSDITAPAGDAPIYSCRAWVNFNGTGTVAIRASGNVSSITDNGTGNYTVNFTTAMPDANYTVANGLIQNTGGFTVLSYAGGSTYSSTSFRFNTVQGDNLSSADSALINCAVFR